MYRPLSITAAASTAPLPDDGRRRPTLRALRLLLPLGLAVMAGCTDIPVDYRVPVVTPAPRRLPTGLPTVRTSVETSNQGSGPLPANGPRIAEAWTNAVTDALGRSGLFTPSGPAALEISIEVQGLTGTDDTAGISAAAARYVVREMNGGRVLLDTTILTNGSSPLDNTTASGEDQRDARNAAVRQNIIRFLGALQSIDPALFRRT